MGIQGRWQVCPKQLEPPQKKAKHYNEEDLCDAIQMKVRF